MPEYPINACCLRTADECDCELRSETMTDTTWGEPIQTDGKRPDWLLPEEKPRVKWRRFGDWITPSRWDCEDNRDYYWPDITAIALPSDHPYYAATEQGYTYWPGGEIIAGLQAEVERLREAHGLACAALQKFLTWANQRCPCENEMPNPCHLCLASVENLEPCKAAENTFPRHILETARAALKGPTDEAM